MIISCCLLFLSVTVMNNFTLCKMEHHKILRFLFLSGVITILLVGGLGVGDKQNGFREVSISGLLTYFCGVAPKGNYRSKPRNQCDIDCDVNITSVSLQLSSHPRFLWIISAQVYYRPDQPALSLGLDWPFKRTAWNQNNKVDSLLLY